MSGITVLPRAIRRELQRLDAPELTLQNLGDGYAVLQGGVGQPLRWQGQAREILNRLRALPSAAGAGAVVAAFTSDD